MKQTYIDTLFILAIYTEGITLEKLLFHTQPQGRADDAAREEALEMLIEMEEDGLVKVDCHGADFHISLTDLGQEVSYGLAGVKADNMVNGWRVQQLAAQ